MEELEPPYKIKHQIMFTRSFMLRIYQEVKEQIVSKLEDLQDRKTKVALTTDM